MEGAGGPFDARHGSASNWDSKSNASIEMYGNGIPSNLPGIPAGPGRSKKMAGLDRNNSQSRSGADIAS